MSTLVEKKQGLIEIFSKLKHFYEYLLPAHFAVLAP